MKAASRTLHSVRRAVGLTFAISVVVTTVLAASTVCEASLESERAAIAAVGMPTRATLASGEYGCTPAHVEVMLERQRRIAEAASLEEARDLALTPARTARGAVQVAATLVPWSHGLADARERLERFETRVDASTTPAQVATEFGGLVAIDSSVDAIQVADLQVPHAQVKGPGRCHYTTGEIIAIVFGFILFIVPGIILLFVLC